MSGAWIVEPDAPQIARSADHVILLRYGLPFRLDNMFVPDDGGAGLTTGEKHEAALKSAQPVAYDPFNPPPWPLSYPIIRRRQRRPSRLRRPRPRAMGEVLDGSSAPVTLDVAAGQVQLLRLVDATSDSPKRLQLRDAAGKLRPMQVVGLDGIPDLGRYGASDDPVRLDE